MIGASRSRILLVTLIVLVGCTYKDIPQPAEIVVDCSTSTFAISIGTKSDASVCFAIDGSFTIHASGGATPYLFSFNGAPFQGDSTLSNIGPGTYLTTVRDANLCEKSISVEIAAPGSTLAATAVVVNDSDCLTDNGTITVTASGGTPPYSFQFGTAAPDLVGIYDPLKFGYYVITVRDDENCIRMLNVWVHRDQTGTSFATQIKPILDTHCAIPGCHNGDLGPTLNWSVLANVQKDAKNIKTRTGNKTMPIGDTLTPDEIALIACWVDDGAKDN